MKTTKTPQEKFKAGLKKSGYDPDAGAKRLLDLIAKQKKEREEFESKYKSAYEGREMKTLKQIIEGIVVMSDYKLDKRGRKYKAHRKSMDSADMTNEGRADDAFKELDTEIENKRNPKPNASSTPVTTRRENPDEFDKSLMQDNNTPKDGVYIVNGRKVDRDSYLKFREDHLNKPVDPREADLRKDMDDWTKRVKDRANARKKTNEEVEQVDEVSKETVSGYKSKAMEYIKKYRHANNPPSVEKKLGKRFAGAKAADKRLSNEEVEQVDEISKGSIEKYMNSAVPDYGHQNLISRVGKGSDKEEATRKLANRSKGITRAVFKTTEKNMKEEHELDEARGRPAGAATLAKRAAAAAKPREDDDESEHYDADSGVEADQHIHVQLKKAADSDQKPFEVSFRNGKKHTVSQKVAKDILGATERLKPEHRKNVHDEIHQSYDNLMSVHRLVAGR